MELSEQKVKAYWNRPGGPFKIFAALTAFCAVGWFALPFLTTVVWNTINFGIACGALGLLLFLVTNKRLRLAVQSVWDILMNNTFGVIFVWDPFVLWRLDIKDMEETREKARQQAIDVDTQKESIQAKINEKKGEMEHLLAKGQAAKKNKMMDDLGLISEQISGYRDYITQLTPMLNNLSKISIFLDKFDKNAGRTIEAAKTKLGLRMDLYKSTTAGNKAINSTLRFFKGDPEKRALLEQSADAYRQDISSKLANMKKAISLSADYMRSIDLDKAASEEQGLKMLDAMDQDTAFSLNAEVPDQYLPKEQVFVSNRKPGEVDKGSYDNLIN
jgi:hypothetical protein